MSASAGGVQQNLAQAAVNADRLSRYLSAAGLAEPAVELSGKLTRMSDDARVLAAALERLALKDTDAKYRAQIQAEREKAFVQAARDRERAKVRYAQKKAERMEAETQRMEAAAQRMKAALNVASEAAASAAEQALPTGDWFLNWATPPMVEDDDEAVLQEE